MKRYFMLGALLLTLSGCATVSDLPQGYRLDALGTEGLAVVSLTLSGKDLRRIESFEYLLREAPPGPGYADVRRRHYFYSARQHARWVQDLDAQGLAGFRASVIVKDQALAEPLDVIESGKPIGRVAALRLPAGEYELYDWRLIEPNQYGGNAFSPKQDFVYRFKVERGRATYLGNLDLHMTEQDMFKIAAENKATRDLGLLAKKMPAVGIGDVMFRPGEMRP